MLLTHQLKLRILNLNSQQQQTLSLAFLPQKHIQFSIAQADADIRLEDVNLKADLLYLSIQGHHIYLQAAHGIGIQHLPMIAVLSELEPNQDNISKQSHWINANTLQQEDFYLRVDKQWFRIADYALKVEDIELNPQIIAQEQLLHQQKQAWKQQVKNKTAPYPPPNKPATVTPSNNSPTLNPTIKLGLWLIVISIMLITCFSTNISP